MGEGVVTNESNTCRIYIINTSEQDELLEINPQQIHPFDHLGPQVETELESEAEEEQITDSSERTKVLQTLIQQDHLNDEEKIYVTKLLEEYNDIFLLPGDTLGHTTAIQHEIPLKDNTLIHSKQYRHAPIHREVIKKDIEKTLKDNIIEPSSSPMSSLVIIVPKRNDAAGNKQWRLCIDYRKLNSQTINDSFPLPNIADILDQLGNSQYFSCFDLASGYHQVLDKPEDRWKTAFSTPEGHWQFVKLPMGLSSAPSL